MPSIAPFVRALYLCDDYLWHSNGKMDLHGIFTKNSVKSFPFRADQTCVFAQLSNGLGNVPFHVDVRYARTQELVHTSGTLELFFPDRHTIVQMAVKIRGIEFRRAGKYTFELHCNNNWACDTVLRLEQE
jgi:hypothetical protein